jgi:hypothetical protein
MTDRAASRDPFARAYSSIRGDLARATRPAGSQIRVDETARALSISPTPVREALAQLGGERLVQGCRRQGYFVPRYSGPELAQLYRLLDNHLQGALADLSHGAPVQGDSETLSDESNIDIGRMLVGIFARTGQGLLVDSGALLVERLATARHVEGKIIDVAEEGTRLRALIRHGPHAELRRAIRAYHRVRIKKANAIASLLAPRARSGLEYISDIV